MRSHAKGSVRLSAGSHGSFGGAVSLRLPAGANTDSTLTVDHDTQGFEDSRTGFKRTHLLWRNRVQALEGVFRFDLEGTATDQQPASPFPRVGPALTDQVPLDANHNPAGAFVNDRRLTFTTGLDRALGTATLWSSTLSISRARQDAFRGFLTGVVTTDPNAHGFRERLDFTDVYFDSHLAWTAGAFKVVGGVDHLHGQGIGRGGDFDYFVNLDGSNPPAGVALPSQADIRIDDRRDFSGLYAFVQWQAVPRLVVEGGLRLNRTEETRSTYLLDLTTGLPDGPHPDSKTFTRLSGSVGATWTAWQAGEDRVNLFAGVRSTFKPAAVDLGLDFILMATVNTLPLLFIGRIISGITAASFSTANAYVADVTPPAKRAQAFGMIGMAFGIGFVVAPAIGGFLGEINVRLPFWAAVATPRVLASYRLTFGASLAAAPDDSVPVIVFPPGDAPAGAAGSPLRVSAQAKSARLRAIAATKTVLFAFDIMSASLVAPL